jgi:hypothetical protein
MIDCNGNLVMRGRESEWNVRNLRVQYGCECVSWNRFANRRILGVGGGGSSTGTCVEVKEYIDQRSRDNQ